MISKLDIRVAKYTLCDVMSMTGLVALLLCPPALFFRIGCSCHRVFVTYLLCDLYMHNLWLSASRDASA